jgi:iron complex outermembrane receptor protein
MSAASFRLSVLVAASLVPWALPARAQSADEALDDLDLVKLLNVEVSTATKTAETEDEAPAVMQVVTQADLRRWGYQTVAEVLEHIQGFYLTDDHVLPDVGVRGMIGGLGSESGVIKVMIDGRSVAFRTTSGNWLGAELVPLESIAQIEIIRGPVSALYGADAFLGVVNIITFASRPDELGRVRARAALGPTHLHLGERLDVAGGQRLGKWSVALGAVGELTDRSGAELPPESPAPILPSYVGGRRKANDLHHRSLGLQAQAGWTDERRGHLRASAHYSTIERGGDFAHWAQLTNGVDAAGNARGTVIALDQLRLDVDGLAHVAHVLDVSLAATYSQGGERPADRIDVASDLFYVKRHQSYRGVDATAEARWMPGPRFNLIAGTETVFDRETFGTPDEIDLATGQRLARPNPTSAVVNLVNVGAYASANLKALDPWLKLTGGLRYDHHNVYGFQLTGRVGLVSRLHRALVAKLLYGNAFKAPSPYLLYALPLRPGDVVGNSGLRPQRVHTVELELSWKPRAAFGLTSSVSYNWLLDKAEFTLQGINQEARNVSRQQSLSWETRADVRVRDQLTAYASFDLVQSFRVLGQEGYAATLIGTKNVVYPPWIARAGVDLSLPSPTEVPLAVGAVAMLVGPRRAADTSIVENGGEFTLPTYLRLDTFLTTRDLYLVRGQESRVALRARNVLNSRGPDAGPSGFELPLTGREILLELRHMY